MTPIRTALALSALTLLAACTHPRQAEDTAAARAQRSASTLDHVIQRGVLRACIPGDYSKPHI